MQERGPVATLSRPGEESPSRRRRGLGRLALTLAVAAVLLAADQVTTSLALVRLHGPVHLIGPLGLDLAFNSGAAFSLFTGVPAVIVPVALVVVGMVVVAAWRSRSTTLSVGLGLVLGGALGNLADRAFRGHDGKVVDFITLTHWPTFNLADAGITVGAVVVVVVSLWRLRPNGSP